MSGAMRFLVNASVSSARSTRIPLMRSRTRRTFCGDTRWNRASALNSIVSFLQSLLRRRRCGTRCWGDRARTARNPGGLGDDFRCLHRVTFEDAGGRELAEFVSHHVLRDIHRDEFASVMHRDGVSHHVGVDGRTPRPGAQNFFVVALVHVLDLGHEVRVDERTFFCRSHYLLLRWTMNLSVRLLFLVL